VGGSVKGVEAVEKELFGTPSAGDPFTEEHLKLVRGMKDMRDVTFRKLADGGFIAEAEKEEQEEKLRDQTSAALEEEQVQPECPRGHPLNEGKTRRDGYLCDKCGQKVAKGDALYSCHLCDHTRCKSCALADKPKPKAAPKPKAEKAKAQQPQGTAKVEATTKTDDEPTDTNSALMKSEALFFSNVALGCIGAVTKKWNLSSFEEMIPKHPKIRKCLMGAAKLSIGVGDRAWLAHCGVGTNDPPDYMLYFQMFDWSFEPPLPRLFLYSAKDMLVTSERVEAWIRHTQTYRPEAPVTTKEVKLSTHCRLWEMELEECASTVKSFLTELGVPVGSDA